MKLQQDPSFFSRKGGSEARCQAVPLQKDGGDEGVGVGVFLRVKGVGDGMWDEEDEPSKKKKHFNLVAEGGAFLMFYSLSSSCWPHSRCDLCICESMTSSVW
uniref:Uncharacterized protein n=1 Tax=Poecilia reticulata TaxID=8081 RepID=A0A3P9QGT0_POERE